jgi:hypothetical protein
MRFSTTISRPEQFHPVGMRENSPTLQRWVDAPNVASPEGTAEIVRAVSRPCGTWRLLPTPPNAEALGYFRSSLRDEFAARSEKI